MTYTSFHNSVRNDKTVWVIGSGATLQHIDPRFFDGKTCVCVNFAGVVLGLQDFFSVTHHHDDAQAVAEARPDCTVITTEFEQVPATDTTGVQATASNILKVPTIDQQYADFDAELHWPAEPDRFVIGPSSVTLAIHWAAYLGAAHIVLAGVDCGELDEIARVADYPDGHLHYAIWENALRSIANKLRKDGVGVYSINPFVTLALEGHTFNQPGR